MHITMETIRLQTPQELLRADMASDVIKRLLQDQRAFKAYVQKKTRNSHTGEPEWAWYLKTESITRLRGYNLIMVCCLGHNHTYMNATCDKYRLYFWVKGRGIGVTEVFNTGLPKRERGFRTVDMMFRGSLVYDNSKGAYITSAASNDVEDYLDVRFFKLEWD